MKLTTRFLAVVLGLLSIAVMSLNALSSPTINFHREGGSPVPPWLAPQNSTPSHREGGSPVPPWQLLAGPRS